MDFFQSKISNTIARTICSHELLTDRTPVECTHIQIWHPSGVAWWNNRFPEGDVICLLLYGTNPTMVKPNFSLTISNHCCPLTRGGKALCCFGWGQGPRWLMTRTFPARRHQQRKGIFHEMSVPWTIIGSAAIQISILKEIENYRFGNKLIVIILTRTI